VGQILFTGGAQEAKKRGLVFFVLCLSGLCLSGLFLVFLSVFCLVFFLNLSGVVREQTPTPRQA
jgi:hypothetical protein